MMRLTTLRAGYFPSLRIATQSSATRSPLSITTALGSSTISPLTATESFTRARRLIVMLRREITKLATGIQKVTKSIEGIKPCQSRI